MGLLHLAWCEVVCCLCFFLGCPLLFILLTAVGFPSAHIPYFFFVYNFGVILKVCFPLGGCVNSCFSFGLFLAGGLSHTQLVLTLLLQAISSVFSNYLVHTYLLPTESLVYMPSLSDHALSDAMVEGSLTVLNMVLSFHAAPAVTCVYARWSFKNKKKHVSRSTMNVFASLTVAVCIYMGGFSNPVSVLSAVLFAFLTGRMHSFSVGMCMVYVVTPVALTYISVKYGGTLLSMAGGYPTQIVVVDDTTLMTAAATSQNQGKKKRKLEQSEEREE